MTLRALSYGNYGIFLIMGSAGYIYIINRITQDRRVQSTAPVWPASVARARRCPACGLATNPYNIELDLGSGSKLGPFQDACRII